MPIDAASWQAIGLTLRLASLITASLLLIATPIAWWLARTRSRWRAPVGKLTQSLGWGLLSFSFSGLLIGSIVFSLPFAILPIQRSFEAMGTRPLEVAATLRARPVDAFFHVALPLARPGLVTAAILTFAHTVGEFGVVLMIGGNIPGSTRVVSTQIYGFVETMDYRQAHWLAAGMVAFSFAVFLALALLHRREGRALP